MSRRGFTLIELAMVIAISAILAVVAYPALRDLGNFGLGAAARGLAADIHFAKNRAVSTHAICGVAFSPSGDAYTLFSGTPATPLQHPLRPGRDYRVDLGAQGVDLVAASFGGGTQLRFDALGQPLDASGQPFLSQGRAILARDAARDTVSVDAFTGGVRGP